MDLFRSGFTADQLECAINGVIPYIGENGNWWVGDADTGAFAGGVDVTGAEIGQTIKVAAVDENGRPTAWEAAYGGGGRLVIDHTTEEETCNPTIQSIDFTTDMNGKPLAMKNCLIKICGTMTNTTDNSTSLRIKFSKKHHASWRWFYIPSANSPFVVFAFASINEQGVMMLQSQFDNANVTTYATDLSAGGATGIDIISVYSPDANKVHLAAGARIQVWEVL